MNLSEHFTLEEMTKSQTGSRKNIANDPSPTEIDNLSELCDHVLEKIRAHFKKPVTVNSGFRGKVLNKAIGGARNSSHLRGEAADIEIAGSDNFEVAKWIEKNLEFDQLILEYYIPGKPTSGWVHVSWSQKKNRKEVLTINKSGTHIGLIHGI